MIVTVFKIGESPRRFGFDSVTDLQVEKDGTVTISGIDKCDDSSYMVFVRPAEYSYLTLNNNQEV